MKKKIRRGFTLAEILISVAIMGVVMGAVITLFYSVFESYQFHQDITEAKQNGQNALAAIQPYISAAALGIPNTKTAFQNAFEDHGSIKKANALLPGTAAAENRFTTTVQVAKEGKAVTPEVTDEKEEVKGTELWLVYATPSGTGVEDDFEVSSAGTNVLLSEEIDGTKLVLDESLKNWVAFPGSSYPMFVTRVDPGNSKIITLATREPGKINAFDEMHYVRAVKIKVIETNGIPVLYAAHLSDNPDIAGDPITEGIVDARFEFGADRVLKVTFLARGSERRNKEYQSEIPGWDGDKPTDMYYRYATVTRSWRIRN